MVLLLLVLGVLQVLVGPRVCLAVLVVAVLALVEGCLIGHLRTPTAAAAWQLLLLLLMLSWSRCLVAREEGA